MRRRPPRSTRTDTLFPYTTLFRSAYYHSCNRGKRSVAIDIATGEGQAELRDLLTGADVVIENYKVGGLVKYGLDPARLRADFPRLIVCSVTGFGQTGPYAHRAGYEYIVQAMSGFIDRKSTSLNSSH